MNKTNKTIVTIEEFDEKGNTVPNKSKVFTQDAGDVLLFHIPYEPKGDGFRESTKEVYTREIMKQIDQIYDNRAEIENNRVKEYWEFNTHEYYGLIVADHHVDCFSIEDVAKVYLESVGGDSVEEILEEGYPSKVSKEYAFYKLASCQDSENEVVGKLLKEFDEMNNTAIVIDGAFALIKSEGEDK